MKYYVVVKDGQVVGLPLPLSDSGSVSPNAHWGLDQMKLNGYLPADLSHDPDTEKIDFASPVVSPDFVSYGRLPLSKSERDARVDQKRLAEYPSDKEVTDALWNMTVLGDDSKVQDIIIKRQAVDEKYPKT